MGDGDASARPAVGADVPTLAALAEEGVAEKRRQRGGRLWAAQAVRQPPFPDAFTAALADGAGRLVLVGEYEGAVVGYATVRVESLHDGTTVGVIDDLYVLPDAREVGVGEALMTTLLTWCEARGCGGVDAVALPGDRETKNFFEANGLVARAIVVHRSFGPPEHFGPSFPERT